MSSEPNGAPKRTQHDFLLALRGQQVLVVFLDSKAVQGVLSGYDPYTLFLQREDGLEVAIFKHAVKYVHAALKTK